MTDDRAASPPRYATTVDWDVRITARDGTELSANIWRPLDAPGPVPAILEMIPYGKDNWRRNADVARGTYFAERGYALCRVDVRGTGSSGGVARDEYTADLVAHRTAMNGRGRGGEIQERPSSTRGRPARSVWVNRPGMR